MTAASIPQSRSLYTLVAISCSYSVYPDLAETIKNKHSMCVWSVQSIQHVSCRPNMLWAYDRRTCTRLHLLAVIIGPIIARQHLGSPHRQAPTIALNVYAVSFCSSHLTCLRCSPRASHQNMTLSRHSLIQLCALKQGSDSQSWSSPT